MSLKKRFYRPIYLIKLNIHEVQLQSLKGQSSPNLPDIPQTYYVDLYLFRFDFYIYTNQKKNHLTQRKRRQIFLISNQIMT